MTDILFDVITLRAISVVLAVHSISECLPAPTNVTDSIARHCDSVRVFVVCGIRTAKQTDLHWLPVRQRTCILFKLCSLVSKCLRCAAPSYLPDLCVPVSATTARSSLRSSSRGDLMISRYGSRSFAVCGPTAWNSLPAAVRNFSSLSSSSCFCSHLKTELFCRAYGVDSP